MDVSVKVTILHFCIHAPDTAKKYFTADDELKTSQKNFKQSALTAGERMEPVDPLSSLALQS